MSETQDPIPIILESLLSATPVYQAPLSAKKSHVSQREEMNSNGDPNPNYPTPCKYTTFYYYYYMPFSPLFVKRIRSPIAVVNLPYIYMLNYYLIMPPPLPIVSYFSTLPLPIKSCIKNSILKLDLFNFFCFSNYITIHLYIMSIILLSF